MTGRLLDVSAMPFEQVYACEDGFNIDMSLLLEQHYEVIQALAASGLIKSKESFGFAMGAPWWGDKMETRQAESAFWDSPDELVWFVGGWGPEKDRYIANAIRKLRALLRPSNLNLSFDSTLQIRFINPGHFADVVDSENEDGTFPWGDFPWGGAAIVEMGTFGLAGAVSALSEIEDDTVAKLVMSSFAKLVIEHNKLLID